MNLKPFSFLNLTSADPLKANKSLALQCESFRLITLKKDLPVPNFSDEYCFDKGELYFRTDTTLYRIYNRGYSVIFNNGYHIDSRNVESWVITEKGSECPEIELPEIPLYVMCGHEIKKSREFSFKRFVDGGEGKEYEMGEVKEILFVTEGYMADEDISELPPALLFDQFYQS